MEAANKKMQMKRPAYCCEAEQFVRKLSLGGPA